MAARARTRTGRSPSARRGFSSRTSPAFPRSSISPPCAMRCATWAASRRGSTRFSRPISSSTTPSRWTPSARSSRSSRTPSSSSSATESATPSCAGARRPSTTSVSCRRTRHRPPGQPRVPRARRRGAGRLGLPGHARRHRLAHHDGQQPRRPRLGRRRDRGRGGDARRAAVHARPAGRRLPALRPPARGLYGDRPRPHRHARLFASSASSASSSSSSVAASRASRSPTARRSRTCRRSTGRRAGSSRSTKRRLPTCA